MYLFEVDGDWFCCFVFALLYNIVINKYIYI